MEQVARSLEHGTCSVGRLEGVLLLVRDGPEPLTSATSEYPDPVEEPQPRPKEPAPQPNLNEELAAKGHRTPFEQAQSIISLRSVLLPRPEPECDEQLQEAKRAKRLRLNGA